jgi:ADP-heptose:LPS heptosyltransferase
MMERSATASEEEGHGETRRVVAIRPGALGDALLALPALAWLHRARPGTRVLFVARDDVLPLARASGLADETSAYGSPMWGVLFADTPSGGEVQARVLVERRAAIAWMSDAEGTVERNLRALGAEQVVVARGRPAQGEQTHTALLLAHGLAGLGIALPRDVEELLASMPRLAVTGEERGQADATWRALGLEAVARDGRSVVALHAGSGGASKRWPAPSFGQLAQRIRADGGTPLLIKGPQDAKVTGDVVAWLADRGQEVAVARGLSVGCLAALLGRCGGYVGNDSGVTHLAALAGAPVVALFGPSDPAQWGPLGRGNRTRALASVTGRMEDVAVGEALAALHAAMAEREEGSGQEESTSLRRSR